jgi:uncharacterized protein YjbI with pentapeptide repeats
MQINSQGELLIILREINRAKAATTNVQSEDYYLHELNDDNDIEVKGHTIFNLSFQFFCLWRVKFEKCNFNNCRFEKFEFNGVEFIECTFLNNSFQNTIFMDCSIISSFFRNTFCNTLYFGMTALEKIEFIENELQYLAFSDCGLQDLIFKNGGIIATKFEAGDIFHLHKSQMTFSDISLQSVTFIDLDLSSSTFSKCELRVSFVNSSLSSKTISTNERHSHFNIDLSSILNSENLPDFLLKDYFGIESHNIKEIIQSATKPQEYQSVFISYSVKDAEFGRELNKVLMGLGVKTFFWEVDAPGAKKLKKIMKDNIRKYDKFLFLASENSLISEACHYEISEARSKYYKTWKEIFIPIHIDDYLFRVEREDIPLKFISDYWENIQQVKEFHSLDFTEILSEDITNSKNFLLLLRCLKN